ncbi:MAG: hypothetical protein ACRDFX_10110 [Chloroflexota bacterium]
MSSWGYVAIAYILVWGSLAIYGLLLARRVVQARKTTRELRESARAGDTREMTREEQDSPVCDAPPVH